MQDHWVLTTDGRLRFRFKAQAQFGVVGLMRMPDNWEEMTSKQWSAYCAKANAWARKYSWGPLGVCASLLENALNRGNCFDFEYTPKPQDQLEFRFLVKRPMGERTGPLFDCIELQIKKTRWHATGAWAALPMSELSIGKSDNCGRVERG